MAYLTKRETVKRHRELWNKVADESLLNKRIVAKGEVISSLGYGPACNDCWCCEYVVRQYGRNCRHCPISWPHRCTDCTSPYYKLLMVINDARDSGINNHERYAELARIIANLPVRGKLY